MVQSLLLKQVWKSNQEAKIQSLEIDTTLGKVLINNLRLLFGWIIFIKFMAVDIPRYNTAPFVKKELFIKLPFISLSQISH